MDWLRWHIGTVNDPKLRVVAEDVGCPVGTVIAVWAAMLECASNAEPRGTMQGWNHRVVSVGLGFGKDVVQSIYDAMQGLTMDGDRLTGWERRQPKRERGEDDTAAERKRRQRDRDTIAADDTVTPAETTSRHVTPCHATSLDVTPRGEEIRGEEKKERVDASQGSAKKPAANDHPAKRGCRLPAEWQPSPEVRAAMAHERPEIDLRLETLKFGDYWRAKAGRDACKLDWDGTWRNWVRNAHAEQPRRHASGVTPCGIGG